MSTLIVAMVPMSAAIEGAYVLAGGLRNTAKQEEALQWVEAN